VLARLFLYFQLKMGIPSMNRVDDSGYYDGSRVFSFLVEPLGLSVDQVKTLLFKLVYSNWINDFLLVLDQFHIEPVCCRWCSFCFSSLFAQFKSLIRDSPWFSSITWIDHSCFLLWKVLVHQFFIYVF